MISLWVLEREFDFGLIVWLLAFLLPVLARFASFLVRLAARILGAELPQKEAEGKSSEAPTEPAMDPDFPVFEELAPGETHGPEPVPTPTRVPSSAASRGGRRRSPRRGDERPLAPSLKEPAPAPFLAGSSPRALPSLQSEFRRTTDTPTSLPAFVSDSELRPPDTLGEWRRAILLQEILAPPLSLRREHRPGQLAPFEFDPTH